MTKQRKYNEYSYSGLIDLLANRKADKTFNALGFYRSLLENESISKEQAIQLRDIANETMMKTFEFLQLKDPQTYLRLNLLGKEYTKADEAEIWRQIAINQQAILKEKKSRHRNFGVYAKHLCGHGWCPLNGLMIHASSERRMHFESDMFRRDRKVKSDRMRTERKQYDPKRELDSETDGGSCDSTDDQSPS